MIDRQEYFCTPDCRTFGGQCTPTENENKNLESEFKMLKTNV